MNSSSPLRQLRQAATRVRILDAARAELAEHGYRDANTARIATAAGVAHGTVFLHFPTRDDVLDAIVFADAMAEAADVVPHLSRSPPLRELLDLHLAQLEAHLPFARLLARELPFLPAPLRTRVLLARTPLAEGLRLAIVAGQVEGRFRRCDPTIALSFWFGAIDRHLSHPDLFPALSTRGPELRDQFLALLEST